MNFDFIPVTELSAIETAKLWRGKKNKLEADQIATSTMRQILNQYAISGVVVIGEGEMDEAPMLYIGEKLGLGGIPLDIAVDPLEGTNLAAKNKEGSITVIGFSPRGSLLNAPDMYMKKMAAGKSFFGKLSIEDSLTNNLKIIQRESQKPFSRITLAMLDRDRHHSYMEEALSLGVSLKLIEDGDLLPAIQSCFDESGIDLYFGIGGAPEGVLSAMGVRFLGGTFQAILVPENEEQMNRCKKMGILDPEKTIFSQNDLVKSDEGILCISAVTDCFFGKGVLVNKNHSEVNSFVIQKDQFYAKKSTYLNGDSL